MFRLTIKPLHNQSEACIQVTWPCLDQSEAHLITSWMGTAVHFLVPAPLSPSISLKHENNDQSEASICCDDQSEASISSNDQSEASISNNDQSEASNYQFRTHVPVVNSWHLETILPMTGDSWLLFVCFGDFFEKCWEGQVTEKRRRKVILIRKRSVTTMMRRCPGAETEVNWLHLN